VSLLLLFQPALAPPALPPSSGPIQIADRWSLPEHRSVSMSVRVAAPVVRFSVQRTALLELLVRLPLQVAFSVSAARQASVSSLVSVRSTVSAYRRSQDDLVVLSDLIGVEA
jgi:hypothetical protein